jgi:hypothetical protein
MVHVVGAAVVMVWVAIQAARLRLLAKLAQPVKDETVLQACNALAARVGLKRSPQLRALKGTCSPMAFGLVKPTIVLPEVVLHNLPLSELEMILAHELGHFRRGDLWVNWVQIILAALWWFHPVLWLVNRSLRRAREDCCDDLLLARGIGSASGYCECLVRAARELGAAAPGGSALACAERLHPLGRRISRLMDQGVPRWARIPTAALCGVIAAAILVLPGLRSQEAQPVSHDASSAGSSKAPAMGSSQTNGDVGALLKKAWDMAYNISDESSDFTNRWYWVKQGIELLRDEGLRDHSDEPAIYRELAWFFGHKLGQSADQANMYYKQQWADEMSRVFHNTSQDLEDLAQPRTDEQKERAGLLREEYKMDPESVKEVDLRYGPLEWRLPEAHAIYWAALGLGAAHGISADDAITLRRVIYQAMALSFQRGTLLLNPFTKTFEFRPNLAIIAKTSALYEEAAQEDETNRDHILKAHRNFLRDAVYFLYLNNRLQEATDWFRYLATNYPDSSLIDGHQGSVPANLTLEEYVVERFHEDSPATSPDQARTAIEGLLWNAYSSLALREDERAAGFRQLAGASWKQYQSKLSDQEGTAGLRPLGQMEDVVLGRMMDPERGVSPEMRDALGVRLGMDAVGRAMDQDRLEELHRLTLEGKRLNEKIARESLEKPGLHDPLAPRRKLGDAVAPVYTQAYTADPAKLPAAEPMGQAPSPAGIASAATGQVSGPVSGVQRTNSVEDARKLFEMGKTKEAKELLLKVVKEDPQNQQAYHYLNLINRKDYQAALVRRIKSKFVEVSQNDARALGFDWYLGNFLMAGGRVGLQGGSTPAIPSLPPDESYRDPNLVYTNRARRAIYSKLDKIRLDEVKFDDVPLREVVINLSEQAKRRDPDKKGINFILTQRIENGASRSTEPLDVAWVIIRIVPSLTDVRLVDVLDAIVKVADKPIKYSVEDYGVVFSAKDREPPPFYTRILKVDPNSFVEGLREQLGLAVTNKLSALVVLLKSLGLDLSPPKSIFFSDREGTLIVRATLQDLDIIETAVQVLSTPPPLINIRAKLIELPEEEAVAFWRGRSVTNADGSSTQTTVLTPPEAARQLANWNSPGGVDLLNEANVTTASGRQTQIEWSSPGVSKESTDGSGSGAIPRVPETNAVPPGPTLDIVPYVSADKFTIQLTVTASVPGFFGTDRPPPEANMKVLTTARKLSGTAVVWDGQTMVFGDMKDRAPLLGDLPVVGRMLQSQTSQAVRKSIVLFITPTIIDPAGNRVHAQDEMPFSRNAVPVQKQFSPKPK